MSFSFPLVVFFSYAHEDEGLRDRLQKHVSSLIREQIISLWHDRRITPGREWEGTIDAQLNSADIVLLLISPDFLASDYCYDVEMKRALERHEAGTTIVVPIIVRPVDWAGTPFAKLAMLPTDALPVTAWHNVDDAFVDVARGIRRVCDSLRVGRWPLPYASEKGKASHEGQLSFRLGFQSARSNEEFEATLNADLTRHLEAQKQLQISNAALHEIELENEVICWLRRQLFEGYPPKPGLVLSDRFELLSKIGEGGIAQVWKAYDERRREIVAVKILHGRFRHDVSYIKRFSSGADAMNKLSHTHIIRVLERAQQHFGLYFFVMQFISGRNLEDYMAVERPTHQAIINIAVKLCEALEHAHLSNVIHRDISPANIIVDDAGDPYLTDFDLARIPHATIGSAAPLGTIRFAAPEIVHGTSLGDQRSDLYSLGMTLLCSISTKGLPPLAFRSPRKYVELVDAPPVIRSALKSILSDDPQHRFQTARDLRLHLQQPNNSLPSRVTLTRYSPTDESEAIRAEALANYSHELKTPLASIMAFSEVLRAGAIHDPEYNLLFVSRIEEMAERMRVLIIDMIQLVRMDEPEAHFDVEEVSILQTARQVFEEQSVIAEKERVQLVICDCPDAIVEFDRDALRTIILNLVDNAIKFTTHGGNVKIRWRMDGDQCIIEVEDTGIGIAMKYQDRIFERFFRVDRNRSHKLGDAGLGLAIVKKIVEAFRGNVRVASDVSKGSTFVVQFPRKMP